MIFPKMYTLMVEIAIFPLFTFYLFILTLFAIINIGVALKFSILPSNLFHIYLCQKATIVITKKYIRHFLCQVPKCLCQSQTRFIIIENIIKTFVNFQLSFYSSAKFRLNKNLCHGIFSHICFHRDIGYIYVYYTWLPSTWLGN